MTIAGTYNTANLNITLRGHHGYSDSTILEKCKDVIFLTPSLSNRTVSIINWTYVLCILNYHIHGENVWWRYCLINGQVKSG